MPRLRSLAAAAREQAEADGGAEERQAGGFGDGDIEGERVVGRTIPPMSIHRCRG